VGVGVGQVVGGLESTARFDQGVPHPDAVVAVVVLAVVAAHRDGAAVPETSAVVSEPDLRHRGLEQVPAANGCPLHTRERGSGAVEGGKESALVSRLGAGAPRTSANGGGGVS
jgi:hypothetical protein